MITKLEELNIGQIILNPTMKSYTTYKTGGQAKTLIYPENIEKLKILIQYLKSENILYKVIGAGSNLIFTDDFYDGVIIHLKNFQDLDIKGTKVIVGAGYSLMRLSLKLSKAGYTGLEFASGIPGTIGGAVFMNAGAYGSDMGYITEKVVALTPSLEIITLSNEELDFHYRTSFFKKNPNYIILKATLNLAYGNAEVSMDMISDRKRRRMESQPLEYPSAGSVFRNPEGLSAWKLIEDAGLKGKKIGGAMISLKHANFIVNDGNATSKDIKELISLVKNEVYEKFNVELKEEQEYVG